MLLQGVLVVLGGCQSRMSVDGSGGGQLINQVRYRFCEGTKVRRAMIPPHGQCEGNSNEGLASVVIRVNENC